MSNTHPKITRVVVIGGGTGTFVVLSGLKNYPLHITAIISTLDSGGSTGRLRDQLGVLPPGDLRQALVALSESDKIWRDLFTYRFDTGDLEGHNFGNIFISALEKVTGSFDEALELAAYILDVRGNVVPVTTKRAELCAVLENGEIIKSEKVIDELETVGSKIKSVHLEPNVEPNTRALKEIKQADFVIFGPGDLYTSIIPNLLVDGVKRAFKTSKAKKVYISNLMTKPAHTDGMGTLEHVQLLEQYLGSNIDFVLVNEQNIPSEMLGWYEQTAASKPVVHNISSEHAYQVVLGDYLSPIMLEQKVSDRVKRSVLRHDSTKLAQALVGIFEA